MTDTVRDLEDILALFADGQTRGVSAQDLRDFVVSVFGRVIMNATPKTADYTPTEYDHMIVFDTAAGNLNCNLPPAATYGRGKLYIIKAIDGGTTMTIEGNGSETIDGDANVVLGAGSGASLTVVSDGVDNWHAIAGW